MLSCVALVVSRVVLVLSRVVLVFSRVASCCTCVVLCFVMLLLVQLSALDQIFQIIIQFNILISLVLLC